MVHWIASASIGLQLEKLASLEETLATKNLKIFNQILIIPNFNFESSNIQSKSQFPL